MDLFLPEIKDQIEDIRMLKNHQIPPTRKEHTIERNGLDRFFNKVLVKTIGKLFENDLCDLNNDGIVTEEEEIKSFILFSNLTDDDP